MKQELRTLAIVAVFLCTLGLPGKAQVVSALDSDEDESIVTNLISSSNRNYSPVWGWEVEVDFPSFTTPMNSVDGFSNGAALQMGAELRRNMKNSPMSYGAHLGITSAGRYPYNKAYSNQDGFPNLAIAIYAGGVAEYNFRQGKWLNPFASGQLGLALASAEVPVLGRDQVVVSRPYVSARVGVELFYTVRLSVGLNVVNKAVSNTFFGFGWVLGGYPTRR